MNEAAYFLHCPSAPKAETENPNPLIPTLNNFADASAPLIGITKQSAVSRLQSDRIIAGQTISWSPCALVVAVVPPVRFCAGGDQR
jgi:hypothetical protein